MTLTFWECLEWSLSENDSHLMGRPAWSGAYLTRAVTLWEGLPGVEAI